jgi:hypothetical protein
LSEVSGSQLAGEHSYAYAGVVGWQLAESGAIGAQLGILQISQALTRAMTARGAESVAVHRRQYLTILCTTDHYHISFHSTATWGVKMHESIRGELVEVMLYLLSS